MAPAAAAWDVKTVCDHTDQFSEPQKTKARLLCEELSLAKPKIGVTSQDVRDLAAAVSRAEMITAICEQSPRQGERQARALCARFTKPTDFDSVLKEVSKAQGIDVTGIYEAVSGQRVRGAAADEAAYQPFDASNILWALTDVILSRAAAELQAAILDPLTRRVCSTCPDDGLRMGAIYLGDVMPSTCEVFQATVREDLQTGHFDEIPGGLATLKRALQADLTALPRRFPGKYLDRTPVEEQKALELLAMMEFLAPVLPAPDRSDSALHHLLAEAVALRPALEDWPLLQRLVLVRAVLQGAYDPKADRLVKPKDSPEYDVSSLEKAALVNLCDSAVTPLRAKADKSFGCVDLLGKVLDPRTGWAGAIDAAVDGAAKIEDAVKRLRQALDIDPDPVSPHHTDADRIAAWARLSAVVIGSTADVIRAIPARNDDERARWLPYLDLAAELAEAISQKDYGRVVILVLNKVKKDKNFPVETARVLTLAANLAQATSADSTKQAIDAFVAPAGSYRKKRDIQGTYLGLNAYAGLFLSGEKESVSHSTAGAAAPWVPVGLEVGLGNRPRWFGRSMGVLVSVIDVGALAAFRLKNSSSVESTPQVALKQVVSPGVFAIFGLRDLPISVALGASYTPELRLVTVTTTASGGSGTPETKKANAVRFGIAVGLDVPIFP